MIFQFLKVLAIVLYIQIAVGCAAHLAIEAELGSVDGKSAETTDTFQSYPPRQEEDLPPLKVEQPYFFQGPMSLDSKPVDIERFVSDTDGEQHPNGIGARIVEGYRVQLFSSRNPGMIDLDEEKLRLKYGQTVYLIYEAPFYKLRFGDFRNMESANNFCHKLHEDGYPDAWVVKSPIVLRQD